jgi:serine/threonine protein kinase/tetratricopeptide (TPR) repeat protein
MKKRPGSHPVPYPESLGEIPRGEATDPSGGDGAATGAIEQIGRRLAAEMRQRWARGERPIAEEFFRADPRVQDQPEAALELIYEEYCLRRSSDDSEAEAEVLGRFPQWASQLRVMLDCHRVLEADHDSPKLPNVGDVVGGFRLVAELGRGSCGRVYLGTQTALADRPVVLKITPLDGSEHLSLARLQHTNIVPLHSVVDDTGRAIRILCMPYFGRATLASLLRQATDARRTGQCIIDAIDRVQEPIWLPAATAGAVRQMLSHVSYVRAMCWIAACLADALEFAHAHGLVHLDLKPSNVLLANDGQPMLLDFHLARAPVQAGGQPPENFGGTEDYMPPEQRAAMRSLQNGRPVETTVDGRADVYALGAILYESLGGQLPITAGARPLSKLNARVSVGLSDIVTKCVADRPEDRYLHARDLADDLRRHASDQPLVGVANRSIAERWVKWRRRRPATLRGSATVAVVAGAVLVLATGTWMQWRDRREQAEHALQFGADQISGGHFAQAAQTLERGLAMADDLPFHRALKGQLRDQVATAKWLDIAQQLHELADRVRVLHGAHTIPASSQQTLASRCRALWEKRDSIADGLEAIADRVHEASSDAGAHLTPRGGFEWVAADLLDIALFAAYAQVKSADGGSTGIRNEALQIIDEAEALFGASAVFEVERRAHRRALALAEAPDRPSTDSSNDDRAAAEFHGLDSGHDRWPAAGAARSSWEHYALGRALLAWDDVPQAAEELRSSLEGDPSGVWPNFYYGLCAYRLHRYDEAVAAFSVCVGAEPNLAGCFYNRALALAALGQTDRALHDYDRALTIDPKHPSAALNRAMLHYALHQLDDAAVGLSLALENGADLATVHYDLALVHMAQEDSDAALEDVRRALHFNPSLEAARQLHDALQNRRRGP